MSSTNALDSEDLDNVPLVRMEDVQPSRGRVVEQIEILGEDLDQEQEYETCIIDGVDFDTECLNNNEDIGSMVSIKSDDVVDSDDAEFIVPDVKEPVKTTVVVEKREIKTKPPDSWPTLEILPGGVIKHANKFDSLTNVAVDNGMDAGEMFACARCSQSFKYLFNLVKHVRWHNDEQRKLLKPPCLGKLKIKPPCLGKLKISIKTMKKKIIISKPTNVTKRKPKTKT